MADEYAPLAQDADVVSALGRALTSSEAQQVADRLVAASELFRDAAGQRFTSLRARNTLRVYGRDLTVGFGPIATVHAVTTDDGAALAVASVDGATLRLRDIPAAQFATVDYTRVGPLVPEVVRVTVAEMVARTFRASKHAVAGLRQYQETTGPFSEGGTVADWAMGAQVALLEGDLTAARRFRPRKRGATIVLGG